MSYHILFYLYYTTLEVHFMDTDLLCNYVTVNIREYNIKLNCF